MRADELKSYCLSKPGASLGVTGFGDPVAKVGEKIFAFTGETTAGVKCGTNREEADEWLHQYPVDATKMAYIGARGWNMLRLEGAIPDGELRDAVDVSYNLVVAGLPKSRRPGPAGP